MISLVVELTLTSYLCNIIFAQINLLLFNVSTVDGQCKNLTVADAPENGGLVCHWYRKEKSIQCALRCNRGYDFSSRPHDYEKCAVSTRFQWTFRRHHEEAAFPGCIRNTFCNTYCKQ